jgi:hypothetical protein
MLAHVRKQPARTWRRVDTGFAVATQQRTDAEKFIFRAERSPMRWFLVGDYEDVAGETDSAL